MRHSERAKDFLRTHPHAEEARLTIEFIARDDPPAVTFPNADGHGTFVGVMESGRWIWWRYAGDAVVIEGFSDP
ncbi:MAG TPA: hypothetical protein VGX28_12005 [Frankiaceae bacterium]|nr:hypothetical protein [Frankiaceae bacterium]